MPLLTPIVLAENDGMNEIPSLSLSAICEVGSTESKILRHVLVSIPSNVSSLFGCLEQMTQNLYSSRMF